MMTLVLLSSGGRGRGHQRLAVRNSGRARGAAEGTPTTGKLPSRRLIPSLAACLIERLHHSRRIMKIVP
jgi:hypothetical protein